MIPENNIEIINTQNRKSETNAVPDKEADSCEKFSSLTTNSGTILSSSGTVTNFDYCLYQYQKEKYCIYNNKWQ